MRSSSVSSPIREKADGETEQVAMPVPRDLSLELLADLGLAVDRGPEDGLVQLERLDGAARAHRGGPWPLVEQSHLAEHVACLEDVERDLLAVVTLLERASSSRDEDVERVAGLPFLDDHAPEPERDRLEALPDEATRVLGERHEER